MNPEMEKWLRHKIFSEVDIEIAKHKESLRDGIMTERGSRHRVNSTNELGESGSRARSYTPSRASKEASRYHLPSEPNAPGTPRASKYRLTLSDGFDQIAERISRHEASRSSLVECRYHQEPKPGAETRGQSADRSATNDGAGVASGSRRYDTPGGRIERLGVGRSTTPDYHKRYVSNMTGSSLGEAAGSPSHAVPPSPRRSRAASFLTAMRDPQQAAPWSREPQANPTFGIGVAGSAGVAGETGVLPTRKKAKAQGISLSSSH